MSTLALAGGPAVRTRPFPAGTNIGEEERRNVLDVLDSGALSGFLADWGDPFYGGPWVRECERSFAAKLGCDHAVALNSGTTGLQASLAAVGVEPGDEVIVPPYTMSASAAAVLLNNAVPVFADIEDETYGLDPISVERAISDRTSALVVVHLFGHPARMSSLLDLCSRRGLAIVEDAAQSVGATYSGRYTGTLGTAGVLSLNRHKIIQCGEGGIVLTSDPSAARIAAMVRNHGEAVVEDEGGDPFNTLGSNYRMTELHAAIAVAQLEKLDRLLEHRRRLAARLSKRLGEHAALVPPAVVDGCTHSYYLYPVRLLTDLLDGVDRGAIVDALRAEGIEVEPGYVKPLYLEPVYQRRSARGNTGCPWACGHWRGAVSYDAGLCPTTERLYADELLVLDSCRAPLDDADVDDVADAFEKVTENLDVLRALRPSER